MEKERPKPPRPKHRAVEAPELPPPPEAPQLADFIDREAEAVIPEPEHEAPGPVGETNADEETKENRNLAQEESEVPAEINEKSREARMSATSYVRELPLDALLPPQNESTKTTPQPIPAVSTLPEAPKPIYPKLETAATLPCIAINGDMVHEDELVAPKVEHKRIYPVIHEASAPIMHGENELLNESQLLTYYSNEQLDFVDDFVDEFVSRELNPRNTLYNLLKKFKIVCEQIQRNEDTKKVLATALKSTNDEVWAIEDHKVSKSGQCGDGKTGSGETNYKKAKLVPGKLTELNQHLNDLTKYELDEGFCLETRARSLALQIQWIIVKLNRDFLTAHNLNTSSIPTLISSGPQDPSRGELIGALSDLFHFLRFPMLPSRFRDSVSSWVVELSSVLLKMCTVNNQLFLTAQILRLSSPIDWAVPLLQTYISTPNLDMTRSIDLFLALLSMVLSPVHKRDDFLIEVLKFYEGDSGWDMIGDDLEETNFTQLKDTDLIALLGQFNIKALYLSAFQKFSARHQGNRRMAMLSIVSFTLMLLKVLDEGLSTHIGMKNVCKKICELIRKTVQYVCSYWKCSAEFFGPERHAIQNEVNRIILQAVFYIASKKSMGLWQFLVDFPFSCATDFCRMRCMLLLRNPTGVSVADLYDINDAKLEETLLSAKEGHLEQSLDKIGPEDRTHSLSAFGVIVSSFENLNINALFNELLSICFFNDQHSDEFSKVGAEIIAVVLDKKPQLLSHILRYVDRRMDHLNNSQILSAASLVKCKLNEEEIGSLIGKWLINRPINHAASVIARRVLSSLDWGSETDLFLPQSVHDVCAETIVKAHVVHCKNRNSLISKSVAKAAKLALKCPDIEQGFDRFCHDLLIRLKISEKPLANQPQTDLTAFYVYLIEKCLSSPEKFLESGLNYWIELVNSACFNNAVVVLVSLVGRFPSRMHLFTANENFKLALERLLHADESSYATQLLVGADKFPGPILRFISCAIANQLKSLHTETRLKQQVDGWIQLLTCKKTLGWNEDKFVLHLVNIISKVAFANDPLKCLGLIETLTSLYQAIHVAWGSAQKGMFSWFSSQVPPPLVQSNLIDANPWASYLMLQAEHKIYSQFYTHLYQNLGKHSERTLDEAVKRAVTKSNIALGVDRLNFYRWLEFCTREHVLSSEVFPLALQQLCIAMFKRESFAGKKFSPGLRYIQCKQAEIFFTELRDKSLPVAEKNATFQQSSNFIRSAGQWIFKKELYAPNFDQFSSSNINMDYLLQMIVSDDEHPWTEFVNVGLLHEQTSEKAKLFTTFCQLVHASSSPIRQPEVTSLTGFFRQLEAKDGDFGLLIPDIPLHQNLPKCDYTVEDCFNMPILVARFNNYLNEFTKMANLFVESKEKIAQLNSEYGAEFQKLYNDAQTTLIVQIKCGNFLSQQCKRPGKVSVVVNASHYNSTVAQNMNENRNKREAEIASLLRNLDSVSIQSAQMEYFCWMLSTQAKLTARQALPYGFMKGLEAKQVDPSLNAVGLHLFYRLCDNNNRPELFLFPALMGCFENCLYYLGQTFVHRNPNEQMNILRLVLSGNPLNIYIIPNFTPHCVDADVLLSLYGELSTAVRNSASTEASLALLERLDIDNTNTQLPPHHFTALMPVIFENLASVPIASKLHKLCVSHFEACMFQSFPNNFLQGFRLLLTGIDSRSVPTTLFDSISNRLQIDAFLAQTTNNTGTKSTISVDHSMAKNSVRLISQQLMKSRQDLTTNLFAVWLDYLHSICQFTDFFIRTIVCQEFASDAPQSIIETSLREVFTHAVSVWGAFLEPVGPSALPPWNVADKHMAETVVVPRFVDLLIWLPHSSYLAPGSESIETLFWQYFVKKLLNVQKAGSSHIFAVYENQLSRLHWVRFWPNLLDLSAMEHAFELSSDVGPLITEILIRIQWPQIVLQMQGQPEEAHRAFYSLLLIVFSRVVQNQKNYAKSRASVEKLLIEFSTVKWFYAKVDAIEKVANLISTSFPADSSLVNPSGPLNAFFNIWREACFFSTTRPAITSPNSSDLDSKLIAQKQALYIRAHVHFLLRSTSVPKEDKLRMYKELLDKCYLLIGATQHQQTDDLKVFTPIAKELIAFWPEVPKEKLSNGLSNTLISWLNQHPDSCLVLLFMDAAISTLGKSLPQSALKLLDNCVAAYFKRRLHCEWEEVCQWINIPTNNFKEWLYTTPSTDSGIETRFLTLNAHLLNEMKKLSSLQEEEKLMKRLSDYLEAVKPKYITNDVAFAVCLEKWQRMVIRQFSNGVSTSIANERLDAYINFLQKIWAEEKGVSFFNVKAIFGKKQAFPIRLQLLAGVMSLYIVQQKIAFNQPPRMQPDQPVLSSRISAFRDLQSNKAFQEIDNVSTVFQLANPYFTQPETYNLNNTANLFHRVSSQLFPESQKLLLHLDS